MEILTELERGLADDWLFTAERARAALSEKAHARGVKGCATAWTWDC
jgi:hypothetical protein